MPAIRVENLGKSYQLRHQVGRGGYRMLRESLTDTLTAPWRKKQSTSDLAALEEFWAIRDLNFEVKPSEVVGIIGRNGAGKSTLLKVLSRITKPTTGRCVINGRVGSLLEVGTGFHPELTGRENIFMNGAILGMSNREVKRNFDAIVNFSEIEKFLDTPVKRYSSGMYVRLAFAVAAHLEPEILIVDEVLAVGDAGFQKKCLGKMQDVSKHGRTVILVSHNMAAIRNLCQKTVVLNGGKIVYDGDTGTAIDVYNDFHTSESASQISLVGHPARRVNSNNILKEIHLMDVEGKTRQGYLVGEPIVMELVVEEQYANTALFFGVGIDDTFGTRICSVATYLCDHPPAQVGPQGRVQCRIDNLALAPGNYCLSLSAGKAQSSLVDVLENSVTLKIEPDDYFQNGSIPSSAAGLIWQRSTWGTS
jgi:lipopolysaccharide transport system ATP-binding protein